jgi:hypothetical protein
MILRDREKEEGRRIFLRENGFHACKEKIMMKRRKVFSRM